MMMLITLALAISVQAGYKADHEKIKTYKQNIETNLQHDNDGVRFWSLYLMSRLKAEHPEKDLSDFNKKLQKMIDKDDSELIRVHAKMTYVYINDDSMAKTIKPAVKDNPIPFYVDLYMHVHNEKFGLEQENRVEQMMEVIDILSQSDAQNLAE